MTQNQQNKKTADAAGQEKKKPIDVFHERTRVCAMLQPFGLHYNRELRDAAPGDRLRFFDGKMAVCLGVCVVQMQTAFYDQLVKLLYGEFATPQRVMDRWVSHVMVMGNRVEVISDKECLMVRYRFLDDDGGKY